MSSKDYSNLTTVKCSNPLEPKSRLTSGGSVKAPFWQAQQSLQANLNALTETVEALCKQVVPLLQGVTPIEDNPRAVADTTIGTTVLSHVESWTRTINQLNEQLKEISNDLIV
jgi:hypothetical protein